MDGLGDVGSCRSNHCLPGGGSDVYREVHGFQPEHSCFDDEINRPESRYKGIGDSVDSIEVR